MSTDPKEAKETESGPLADSGARPLRRGGARREVTDRVVLKGASAEREFEGWSLNVSRGGLRIVTEGDVQLGEQFELRFGEDTDAPRAGRVVWLRKERDGIICGIEFVSTSNASTGAFQSVPPAPPGSIRLPGVPEE